jgi:murein DD-endopeptidase MepM/ murein hydrolase activator NlpD
MDRRSGHSPIRFLLPVFLFLLLAVGYLTHRWFSTSGTRSALVLAWLNDPTAHPDWPIQAGERCGSAPFIMPTYGFIGYLWDDSFRPGHRHQGLDIFGGSALNQTPVVAAYPGYLTRLADWKSSLIIRIPDDPIRPGRQIWTYYTHMADSEGNSYIADEFPPDTSEVYIDAGTLLGHQGNYSGDPFNPTGIHLHFSIVKDDGQGRFLNELQISNTLDPSPYLGLSVNANENRGEIPNCESTD